MRGGLLYNRQRQPVCKGLLKHHGLLRFQLHMHEHSHQRGQRLSLTPSPLCGVLSVARLPGYPPNTWPQEARQRWREVAADLHRELGCTMAEAALLARNEVLRGHCGAQLPWKMWRASLGRYPRSALDPLGGEEDRGASVVAVVV